MNILNTLGLSVANVLAADAKPVKPNVDPSTPLFGPDGYIGYFQLILIALLIGLIVFWVIYKKKQRDNQ